MDDNCPPDENENPNEHACGIHSNDQSQDNPSDSENENSVIQTNEGSHSNDKPQDHHMRHEDTTSSTVTQQDEDAPKAQAACTVHCCSDEKGFQPID
jgi:hypothetical protein